MRFNECVNLMQVLELKRSLQSIEKEGLSKKGDVNDLRNQMVSYENTFKSEDSLVKKMDCSSFSRNERILMDHVIYVLLESDNSIMEEDDVFNKIKSFEEEIVASAESNCIEKVIDDRDFDIYKTVLETAFEDNIISEDELRLIEKLREKFKINRYQSRVIEAIIGVYPKNMVEQEKAEYHSMQDLENVRGHLEKRGLIFYLKNYPEKGKHSYVIPEEMIKSIRDILKFELGEKAHIKLLEKLKQTQLQSVLDAKGLPRSGKKEEMIKRIIDAKFKPSEELEVLSNGELGDLCKVLPEVKSSGTKNERVYRVIDYFNSRVFEKVKVAEDGREIYYNFFEDLAQRNTIMLRRNEIITPNGKSEGHIGILFEEATRYIFEKKFGHDLIILEGNRTADGAVRIKNKGLLLWDNKSKKRTYDFNTNNQRQFRDYIDRSKEKVSVFLVIVPKIENKNKINVEQAAQMLKNNNIYETDVCVISAYDLKAIAEEWRNVCSYEKFPLKVFNYTGIATKDRVMSYLKNIK